MPDYRLRLDLSWLPQHEYVVWNTKRQAYWAGLGKYTTVFARAWRFSHEPGPCLNEVILGVVKY